MRFYSHQLTQGVTQRHYASFRLLLSGPLKEIKSYFTLEKQFTKKKGSGYSPTSPI